MDTEANPTTNLSPPSPPKITKDAPCDKNEEVTITGSGYSIPEVSRVLTKLVAKDETVLPEKGKSMIELPSYENMSAEELHAGYLDRLATSREMEVGLVSMMKSKYEESLKAAESNVTGLKKNLEIVQNARATVKEKLRLALEELEKTKAHFEKQHKSLEAEKAALLERTENVEGQLKPMTEELSGLKWHIAHMTQAIFDKYLAHEHAAFRITACLCSRLYIHCLSNSMLEAISQSRRLWGTKSW